MNNYTNVNNQSNKNNYHPVPCQPCLYLLHQKQIPFEVSGWVHSAYPGLCPHVLKIGYDGMLCKQPVHLSQCYDCESHNSSTSLLSHANNFITITLFAQLTHQSTPQHPNNGLLLLLEHAHFACSYLGSMSPIMSDSTLLCFYCTLLPL